MKKLNKRKELASKVLGVGKNKIIFDSSSLEEIKEAITKQDIRDLYQQGIIRIRYQLGRKQKEKRKTKKGPGKIRIRVKPGKRGYIISVRKLRNYINELRIQGKINRETYQDLRKKIKSRLFKNKASLKDHMGIK